jgi:hypothetical protein
MTRRRAIECWAIDRWFGELVVTGYVEGRPFCRLFRWIVRAKARVGTSEGGKGADEVLELGLAARDPYAGWDQGYGHVHFCRHK